MLYGGVEISPERLLEDDAIAERTGVDYTIRLFSGHSLAVSLDIFLQFGNPPAAGTVFDFASLELSEREGESNA
jgi:hypothetical protein